MVDLLYKLSVLVKGYKEKDAATEVSRHFCCYIITVKSVSISLFLALTRGVAE